MKFATKITAAERTLYRICPTCRTRLVVDWQGPDPEGDLLFLIHCVDEHCTDEVLAEAEAILKEHS